MRVFCPSCQEPVTIPDELAGKATFCPLCKAAFTAPTLFSSPAPPSAPAASAYSALPPPETPAAPESRYRETPAPHIPPAPAPAPTPAPPPGYARAYGFSLVPDVLQWVAPGCLVFSVLMTFFSWNGAYPGGYGVYTQGGWGAAVGGFSTDPVGDEVFRLELKPPEGQKPLHELVPSNFLLWLYLPLL